MVLGKVCMGLLRAIETKLLSRSSGFCSGGIRIREWHVSGGAVRASEVGMKASDECGGSRGQENISVCTVRLGATWQVLLTCNHRGSLLRPSLSRSNEGGI